MKKFMAVFTGTQAAFEKYGQKFPDEGQDQTRDGGRHCRHAQQHGVLAAAGFSIAQA